MGYTTEFDGEFHINERLDKDTQSFLTKLNETRRMKRNIEGFGIDGEFYVDGGGHRGQCDETNIVNYNTPPSTQPSLWCQWKPNEAGTAIEWDGGEKFYNYVEWLKYIISKVLAPKGYILNGLVEYQGEDSSDFGVIAVKENKVLISKGKKRYGAPEEA